MGASNKPLAGLVSSDARETPSMARAITFRFEGQALSGRAGETLAAALCAAGITEFRETQSGARRGLFCGMGVCQDCLVDIDGKPSQRACMTKLERPVNVRREIFGRASPGQMRADPPKLIESVPEEQLEVLVIGAGPGGLSAAIAARLAGANVIVIDERPLPGGQYFKQRVGNGRALDGQQSEGRRLIDRALKLGIDIRNGIEIWGAFGAHELIGTVDGLVRRFNPSRLIVATGAFERGIPLPGWTLPGVMTTGAAQTLWRSYGRLPGQRVLVAGNGPLNLQVASELRTGGATIVAVVELAARPRLKAVPDFARLISASPRLFFDGLEYRARLRGVPVIHNAVVTRVERASSGLVVHTQNYPSAGAGGRTFQADVVCLGYGFEPSNEILRALDCRHAYDDSRSQFITLIDEDGRTSVSNVYSLGDCTGLGGARIAMAQGTITGFAAARDLGHWKDSYIDDVVSARRALARHRKFQRALWNIYAAPKLNLELATPETIVCRCEEVTAQTVAAALVEGSSIGELKRATRAGMGSCQGRYCGPVLYRALAPKLGCEPTEDMRFAPRMPIKPVTIADIARWPK
jgi:D-hydroxyproline dehydrogenase subunit alpha